MNIILMYSEMANFKFCNNFLGFIRIFLVILQMPILKKPLTKPVICVNIIKRNGYAGVAELADAQDLKSCGP